MQRKLNEDFIDDYCEKFAKKVTLHIFSKGVESINGDEIRKVTPSQQVNFFIIKLLFSHWQKETKKLKSPFFNYKHEEVRQAMIQFMNVLSQHIEVAPEKFESLLNHAVKNTIYLVAMPQAYLEFDLENRGIDILKSSTIETTIKYLKIHKEEIKNYLSDMKGMNYDDVVDELSDKFDYFNTSEAIIKECKSLSQILKIDIDMIFATDYEHDEDDDILLSDDEILGEESKSTVVKTDNSMVVTEEPKNKIEPSEIVGKDDDELPSKQNGSPKSKNAILNLISPNHRHLFIKELFRNDKEEFNRILNELETYDNFDDSVKFLVRTYVKHNDWDMQSDEVKEFLKVLFRRFR